MDNSIETKQNPVSPTGQAVNGSPTVQQVSGSQAAQVAGNTVDVRSAAKTMTRTQAEAKYTKLLEDMLRQLEALESSVRAATNTKVDIKTGTKALGICFREFLSTARIIGMTRSPDATEQRVRCLQQQQQQQHAQTMKLISEVRDEQLQHQQLMQKKMDTLLQNRQAEGLSNDMTWSQDRINNQEERLASQDRKLDKIISELDQIARVSADAPQEQQHQQQEKQQQRLNANCKEHDEQNSARKTKRQAQRQRMKQKQKINTVQEEAPVASMQPVLSPEGTDNNNWETVKKKGNGKNMAKVTSDAVIVKITEDKTYEEILRSVKIGLSDAGLTDEVGMSKRTMNGDLLLQLKKKTNKTSQLRTVVEDVTRAETYLKTSTVAVEIRGLDTDATPEDLAAAISARTANALTKQSIKTIKPGQGGKSTAVVLLSARAANELVTGPRLRIGWASCSTRIRHPMIRCTRCFDFGHRKNTCTGPDRTGICLNCWGPGHTKKDCDSNARCGLCEEDGVEGTGDHFSGSGKCPAFKRFLANCRDKR